MEYPKEAEDVENGWDVSFKTWLFTDRPDGPRKDQSWVLGLFV